MGVLAIYIEINDWLFGTGESPNLANLAVAITFILWGLAEVVNFRLVLLSFSTGFLSFALIGLEKGHIKLTWYTRTVYLDETPWLFTMTIFLVCATSVAAGIWAMRATPMMPNKALQSTASSGD